MKVYKTAATIREIPVQGSHTFNVPSDAILLRHIYLQENTSAERKCYVIRIMAFPIDGQDRSCLVAEAYWGGTIYTNGTPTQDKQIKYVKLFAPNGPEISGATGPATSAVLDLKRKKMAKGYEQINDIVFSRNSATSVSSIPLNHRSGANGTGGANAASSPNAANAGNARPSQTPQAPQNRPTMNYNPPQYNNPTSDENDNKVETPEDKWARLKDKALDLIGVTLRKIQNREPNAAYSFDKLVAWLANPEMQKRPEYNAMFSPEVKPSLSAMFNEAADLLFFKVLSCPQDILDKVGVSEEVKKKIHDYNSEIGHDDLDIPPPSKNFWD